MQEHILNPLSLHLLEGVFKLGMSRRSIREGGATKLKSARRIRNWFSRRNKPQRCGDAEFLQQMNADMLPVATKQSEGGSETTPGILMFVQDGEAGGVRFGESIHVPKSATPANPLAATSASPDGRVIYCGKVFDASMRGCFSDWCRVSDSHARNNRPRKWQV